jgi:hypothetical protein
MSNHCALRLTSASQYMAKKARIVNALQRNNQAGVAPSLASFQYGRVITDNTTSTAEKRSSTIVSLCCLVSYDNTGKIKDVSTPPIVRPANVPPRVASGTALIIMLSGSKPAFDTMLNTEKKSQPVRTTWKLTCCAINF